MEKVKIPKIKFELVNNAQGGLMYDVTVLNPEATVQDYLDEINTFQEEKLAPCDDCSNCCWERVPLTAPDAIKYGKGLDLDVSEENSKNPGELAWAFVKEYGEISGDNNKETAVDVCLKRKENGSCIFLDLEKLRCQAHNHRPFVCQSYYCLPASKKAMALRSEIVNQGENQLVTILAEKTTEDWQLYTSPAFEGKEEFNQVFLKELVSADLWQELQK